MGPDRRTRSGTPRPQHNPSHAWYLRSRLPKPRSITHRSTRRRLLIRSAGQTSPNVCHRATLEVNHRTGTRFGISPYKSNQPVARPREGHRKSGPSAGTWVVGQAMAEPKTWSHADIPTPKLDGFAEWHQTPRAETLSGPWGDHPRLRWKAPNDRVMPFERRCPAQYGVN